MERFDFYDSDTYDSLLPRIASLTAETRPKWGEMNSAQMLAHCAEIAEVAGGKALVGTPWYVKLMSGFIKRMVLSDKPYPRSTKTHPQYVMSSAQDFEEQTVRLLDILSKLKASGPEGAESERHDLFGKVTAEEAGWAAYKHLDHHLVQFGV